MIYFNGSIADEYYRKTDKTGNYEILKKIVDRRSKEIEKPPDNSLIIHLRIGDVIDWEYSGPIDDLLNGLDGDFGYLKSYDYFKEKILFLNENNIKKIIIVGGYHTEEDHSRSEEYTEKIKRYLESNDFEVKLKINEGTADEDFLYMCNSKYFLKTDGGYSRTINRIVEMKGGIILENN